MEGRVLLVATNPKSRAVLPDALRTESPGLAVDVAARTTEALDRLSAGGYDVAVACTDAPDELALVVRLKKRRPDIPVVVLSRVAHAGFEALARSMGAASVVRKTSGLSDTAHALTGALEASRGAREVRALARQSKEASQELRRLAQENRRLISDALGLAAADEAEFTTLLVEDDAIQADFFVHVLRRARLPSSVHVARSVPEAQQLLSAPGPIPSLIVSDLNLPGKSGLDFLRWVRANPRTQGVAFLMLTGSEAEADVEAAYQEGVNFYLAKSDRLEDVVDIIRGIYGRYRAERDASP